MKKQFVSHLKLGDNVQSYFAVASKKLLSYSSKSSRSGEKFLKITLTDSSGTINGMVWDNAEKFNSLFKINDIIYVKGTVSEFNDLQITVTNIEPIPHENINIEDFIPKANIDLDKLRESLDKTIQKIQNPFLNQLLSQLFSGNFKKEFCSAPGGKLIHHAYCGGLLEHTLEVVSLADRIASLYQSSINRDILLTGALLHDIGKTKEYDLNSISFEQTDKGKLHGHLVLGRDLLLKHTSNINNFPPELEDELSHMILSHHGYREWGSPEPPKTIEAYSLFYADLVSARLSQAADILMSMDEGESWSKWNRLLERSFFNPIREYNNTNKIEY